MVTRDMGLLGKPNHLEGYLFQSDLEGFLKKTFAVVGENTNLLVHIVDDDAPIELNYGTEAPIAVAAVDLMASLIERERALGHQILEGLLNGWCG
jgi:hypothetical protein